MVVMTYAVIMVLVEIKLEGEMIKWWYEYVVVQNTENNSIVVLI